MSKNIEPINDALLELLSVLEPEQAQALSRPTETQTALFEAARLVGKALGVEIKSPQNRPEKDSPLEFLEAVAEASQCRLRFETLSGNWWEEDCGPLLAFQGEGGNSGALIRKKNHYYWHDPLKGTPELVTSLLAETFSPSTLRFYRSFPALKLSWKDIFKFVLPDILFDIKRIFLLQIILGLFALFIPIATGAIFDHIIPNADTGGLLQFMIILLVTTSLSSFYGLGQFFHLVRSRFIANIAVESAVWDRLLKLPLSFFRQFTAGDLAYRARGVDILQEHISSAMLTSLLSGAFSIFSLLLMLYYDWILTLYATALAILALFITLGFAIIQLKYQRPLLEMEGKILGLLFQLLSNISKLRVANSEKSAFARWAKQFSEKNILFLKVQMNILWFGVFYPLFMVLSTAIIYFIAAQRGDQLSFGSFLAFNAAFGQFLAALFSMGDVIIKSLLVIPVYERAKPILNTLPEIEIEGNDPGILKGEIVCRHLSFRYQSDTSNILDDISLNIKPGSLISLIGPSGAGKSTLFRLLLQFEAPNAGQIYYDGHDVSTLNVRLLRKQIGSVLQNTLIFPGSIYENITALSPDLTLEDAWQAASLMQIADEIKEMPMGMQTLISEGGRNISVGQRQRILLARAIVHKPRILFLDEATSALDQTTQAKVIKSLEELNITRVMASHRLSTFKKADCIYVFREGKIVQEGSFETLIQETGLFTELVKWQLV